MLVPLDPAISRLPSLRHAVPKSVARRPRALLPACVRRLLRRGGDAGMTTAEYAVGTLAAVAFAAVLLKVVTSHAVQAALTAIVQRALR